MLALNIIETDTYRQALIVRAILEGAGFPTVAAHISFTSGAPDVYSALTVAPSSATRITEVLALGYEAMGDRGLERAKHIAEKSSLHPLAVPADLRDLVRHALVATLYTAADEEGATLVSEPARGSNLTATATATANHDPGDEHTEPGVHNPLGGGWDSRCKDEYDSWKSAR